MKKAVIYARVSTAKQADEELPIEGQVEQCRKKAEALGASVEKVYCDKGLSGRSDSRPAFQEAIAFCEATNPDYFITWSTSRFARNMIDAGWYKRLLRQVGTSVAYVSIDIKSDTDEGWILDTIFEFTDELYSRQVSKDTSRSMVKNAREGYWNGGRPAFGYEAVQSQDNQKRKRLAIVPAEAEVVRQIFDLKRNGHGGKFIAHTLNQQQKFNRGRPWSKTTINTLLRNEVMVGRMVFGKRKTEGKVRIARPRSEWIIVESHNPIISPEVWEVVQGSMEQDSVSTGGGSPISTHLFTGILKCGKCGASLQIETAKGRAKRYSYYNCRNAQRGSGCENRRIPADAMDDWLLGRIMGEVFTEENLRGAVKEMAEMSGDWARDRRRRRAAITGKMTEVDGRNKKLFEVLELLGKDAPNMGDLTKRIRANNDEVKQLECILADIDAETAPVTTVEPEQMAALRELLIEVIQTTKNPKKLRTFFGSFINGIHIEGDIARIEYRPAVLVHYEPAVHSKKRWLPGIDPLGTKIMRLPLPDRLRQAAA